MKVGDILGISKASKFDASLKIDRRGRHKNISDCFFFNFRLGMIFWLDFEILGIEPLRTNEKWKYECQETERWGYRISPENQHQNFT